MNDHLNDGLQKDGFSLSEVTSRVVPHSGGTATAATVRLERLDEDEHTGRVSFVVTTCTPGKDGDAQVLSVRPEHRECGHRMLLAVHPRISR